MAAAAELDSSSSLQTEHLYYGDTYNFSCEAKVLLIKDVDLEQGTKVIVTDRTVLHPQGGGQPADTGMIRSKDKETFFKVSHVQKPNKDSLYIEHIGKFEGNERESFSDSVVEIIVDEGRRRRNARLHSAGHLLDSAFDVLGRTELEPTKGYHFPEGPYVEYIGNIPPDERDKVIADLNQEATRLIEENSQVLVSKNDHGDRIVNVGGSGCPCGGTHVKWTGEIGQLTVTKITKKKKIIRVSYVISD
ncbi:alanine--tRNA ligase-like [Corticium candelabrum]|uniref:alanine--tRNA ligase-like n=1 Tax=Corticium candelabrum TaxID=121492 RepID=UPI002E27420E|nr:alanine--tRNA ligase-like [Corticium candelabrum]